MRRETSAVRLGLWTLAALAGPVALGGETPGGAPVPAETAPSVRTSSPLRGDVLSGCQAGAPLVKAQVLLRSAGKTCKARVRPASVCVAPGGVVRFLIHNQCKDLVGTPALRITQPVLETKLDGKPFGRKDARPLLGHCTLEFDQFQGGKRQVVLCDVAEGADEGFYKYEIQGKEIEPLDPDIEVRN